MTYPAGALLNQSLECKILVKGSCRFLELDLSNPQLFSPVIYQYPLLKIRINVYRLEDGWCVLCIEYKVFFIVR